MDFSDLLIGGSILGLIGIAIYLINRWVTKKQEVVLPPHPHQDWVPPAVNSRYYPYADRPSRLSGAGVAAGAAVAAPSNPVTGGGMSPLTAGLIGYELAQLTHHHDSSPAAQPVPESFSPGGGNFGGGGASESYGGGGSSYDSGSSSSDCGSSDSGGSSGGSD